MKFEIVSVTRKTAFSWDVTPCSWCALKINAAGSTEKLLFRAIIKLCNSRRFTAGRTLRWARLEKGEWMGEF